MNIINQILLAIIIILGVQSVKPQDICITDSIKVEQIKGQVVTLIKGKETPITKGVVVLYNQFKRKNRKEVKLINNGLFLFPKIKPGKYVLETKHPFLPDFSVDVEIIKKNQSLSKKRSKIILILGYDLLIPCNGSRIEIREENTQSKAIWKMRSNFL